MIIPLNPASVCVWRRWASGSVLSWLRGAETLFGDISRSFFFLVFYTSSVQSRIMYVCDIQSITYNYVPHECLSCVDFNKYRKDQKMKRRHVRIGDFLGSSWLPERVHDRLHTYLYIGNTN